MKKMYTWISAIGLTLVITSATAQTGRPPAAITDTFAKMFPTASNVDWEEKTNNFTVFFNLKDRKCEAKFTKTGGWLSTEETIALDSLPHPVRDAFKASKYADWNETSAYCIRTGERAPEFHLVVSRSDLGRKILFFSPDGKLLKDH
jgi:hypothetical protein